jgi:hypothetical protein
MERNKLKVAIKIISRAKYIARTLLELINVLLKKLLYEKLSGLIRIIMNGRIEATVNISTIPTKKLKKMTR